MLILKGFPDLLAPTDINGWLLSHNFLPRPRCVRDEMHGIAVGGQECHHRIGSQTIFILEQQKSATKKKTAGWLFERNTGCGKQGSLEWFSNNAYIPGKCHPLYPLNNRCFFIAQAGECFLFWNTMMWFWWKNVVIKVDIISSEKNIRDP